MSEKKVGKRLLTWVLVLVMTLSLLPLNVLADEVGGEPDVVYGYDNGSGWVRNENSNGTDSITTVEGVDSVRKTAERVGKPEDNTYYGHAASCAERDHHKRSLAGRNGARHRYLRLDGL